MQPKRPEHLNLLQRAFSHRELVRHIRDIPHERLELRATPVRYEFISQCATIRVISTSDVLGEKGRRIAPCFEVAFLGRPEDEQTLEQGLFWVEMERAEERQVLRCDAVWTERALVCIIGEWLVKTKTVFLCRGREEVELAVDIGEGDGEQVDDPPAERA